MPTWHIPSAIFKIYRIFGHISFGIWVSFPNMGILAVPCRLKKQLCWTAVAKPDLLRHFFNCSVESMTYFTLHYLSPITTSIHYNALQCIQNEPKMHCFVSLLRVNFWYTLNALQCIVVNSRKVF